MLSPEVMISNPFPYVWDLGIALVRAEDFKEWQLDIRVLDDNPIYKGKTYRLNFKFTNNYPIGSQSQDPERTDEREERVWLT